MDGHCTSGAFCVDEVKELELGSLRRPLMDGVEASFEAALLLVAPTLVVDLWLFWRDFKSVMFSSLTFINLFSVTHSSHLMTSRTHHQNTEHFGKKDIDTLTFPSSLYSEQSNAAPRSFSSSHFRPNIPPSKPTLNRPYKSKRTLSLIRNYEPWLHTTIRHGSKGHIRWHSRINRDYYQTCWHQLSL